MKCITKTYSCQYGLWGFTSSEPKQDGSDCYVEHFGSPHLATAIGSFMAFHLPPLLTSDLSPHLLRQEDRPARKIAVYRYIRWLTSFFDGL